MYTVMELMCYIICSQHVEAYYMNCPIIRCSKHAVYRFLLVLQARKLFIEPEVVDTSTLEIKWSDVRIPRAYTKWDQRSSVFMQTRNCSPRLCWIGTVRCGGLAQVFD